MSPRDKEVPYRCPKGGLHDFSKTKLVEYRPLFSRRTAIKRVRVCSKCGSEAGKLGK